MASVFSTAFLGKEFEFPSDILTLKKEYDYLANEQETCLSHFDANFTLKVVSEEVLYNGLKYYAEHYIQKLCDQGIYDKNIDDYIYNNEGYKHCLEMNSGATETLKVIKQEAQNALSEADEAAQSAAAASVTGSGVQVYSSSLTTLFAHAVAENVTVNSQTKKAIEQYNSQVRTARAKTNAWIDEMQGGYLGKTYRPAMQGAILAAISDMTQKYLADLAGHGLFDLSAVNYFEIDRSNALVQNLKMIADKKSALLQAFEAYPFNLNVYIESAKLGLFNEAEMTTASRLKIDNELRGRFVTCPNCGYHFLFNQSVICPKCNISTISIVIEELNKKEEKELQCVSELRNAAVKNELHKYKTEQEKVREKRLNEIPATKDEIRRTKSSEVTFFAKLFMIINLCLFCINGCAKITKIEVGNTDFLLALSFTIMAISAIIFFGTKASRESEIDFIYKNEVKENPEEYKKEKLKQIMEDEMRKITKEVDEKYDKKVKEIHEKYNREIEEIKSGEI